jgi:hypothetical protein
MPKRARLVQTKFIVRPFLGRVRVAIAGGLLLAALGTSSCSLDSSSPGRSLPVSVTGNNPNVHSSKCTLDSSGIQAVATGTFNPQASLPVNAEGEQEGSLRLQLSVVGSKSFRMGHVVIKNPGLGENYEGVSVGQTSWHIKTTVERLHGFRAARCVVTYEIFEGP